MENPGVNTGVRIFMTPQGTDFKSIHVYRGQWTWPGEYIGAMLSYNIGFGPIFRTPYMIYRSGGAIYMVPFVFFLLLLGLPMTFLEASLGQYTRSGVLTCWDLVPVFKGIGVAMMILTGLYSIYFNVLIAWSLFYLFASAQSPLPWSTCTAEWATEKCSSRPGFNNETIVTTEYFNRRVLHGNYSLSELGNVHWEIVLCLLLAWILVGLCLIKTVKSYNKLVYPIVILKYILLIALLIRGSTLPGSGTGRKFLVTPDLYKLLDYRSWGSCATIVFYHLSLGFGGIITWSSFNRHQNDVMRDSVIMIIMIVTTIWLVALMIFSFLGFLAVTYGVYVDMVVTSGFSLVFEMFPLVFTQMPLSQLWSALFYFFLVLVGLGTQVGNIATLTTGLMDQFPRLWKYDFAVTIVTCFVGFILGLTMTTNGGASFLTWMDNYVATWNTFILALLEIIALIYAYGFNVYRKDLGDMFGKNICFCCPWSCMQWAWTSCWLVITPVIFVFLLITNFIDFYHPVYPAWAMALGWIMFLLPLLAVVIGVIVQCIRMNNSTLLTRPPPTWGPPERQRRPNASTSGQPQAMVQMHNQAVAGQPTPYPQQQYAMQVANRPPIPGTLYPQQPYTGQPYQYQPLAGQPYQAGNTIPVTTAPYPSDKDDDPPPYTSVVPMDNTKM